MILSDQRGAVLLVLIITMTLIAVLGAAILSISTTALYSELNTNSAAQAWYLAESGKRYVGLYPLNTGDYYTFRQKEDYSFEKIDHSVMPLFDLTDAGFRIRRTECSAESAGIVRENTPFETIRKIPVLKGGGLNGMPCWGFNEIISGIEFRDNQGGNTATVKGTGTPLVTDSAYGMALDASADNYVETDFNPFCEIGNMASFTISFQAKPDIIAKPAPLDDSVVLGLDDGSTRFTVKISGERWRWAYGNIEGGDILARFGQWQHVVVTYNADADSITMQVESCGDPAAKDTMTGYQSSGGTGAMPRLTASPSGLFIGAENKNGSADFHFKGYIDEVSIYNTAMLPEDVPRYCEWTSPMGHYPFDGNANDMSGNGNNGTVIGAVPVFGRLDQAYEFDGTGSYIHVPDSDSLDLTDTGTLAAWIYINSFNPLAGIIHKGDKADFSDEAYTLQFGQNGFRGSLKKGIMFAILENNTTDNIVVSARELELFQWYHIAVTWDNRISGKMFIYIDGQMDADEDITITGLRNTNGGLNIGAQLTGTISASPKNFPFDGIIDEVHIFDRTLSPDEICRLYQNP